jgi:hypothetical protein
LPNGKVLVAGGFSGVYLTSAELFDPAGGTNGAWTATGDLNTARDSHTATLLPNGKVLVAGGFNGVYLTSAELFDPAGGTNGTWTATGDLNTARDSHTATLLPNGMVLVAAGNNGAAIASAELYDPANGTWTATGNLNTAREQRTATLLPNGMVLVAGGADSSENASASAELYDPANATWTATGSLNTARDLHTATLLPNGMVLVAGGGLDHFGNGASASAELFDPAGGTNGTWTATGSLNTARDSHTATLLPNGMVLVAGGLDSTNNASASAELFDPAGGTNGTWTATGSLNTARYGHTATLLPNGMVLVAGGLDSSGHPSASAELFDPAGGTNGTWTATTGTLNTARFQHTATLLPNGMVLVAGGFNYTTGFLVSAELYNPVNGTWTATGSLNTARDNHTATLLPNGMVLVAGGVSYYSNASASAELFDPAGGTNGTWTATGSLNTARGNHTATLLPNGMVLVAAGTGSGGVLASAELYDVGFGFVRPDWQPQIATVTSPLISSLTLTGSRFQGISQASGGSFQDSSTNYPLVQLRNIDNSQVAFLPVDPTAGWSNTSFTSTRVNNFPPGPALVTVFTNGIPSDSKYLVVSPLTMTSVVSRMTHGSAGTFDVNLPLTGTRGVECRTSTSLGAGNYTLVFTFLNNLTSVASASVSSGTGSVDSTVLGPNASLNLTANQYQVNLTGVSNQQYITITLHTVQDSEGNTGDIVGPQMGVLIGDVNATGGVDGNDVAAVQAHTRQAVNSNAQARFDVNADGTIDGNDVALIQGQTRSGLPSNP